MNPHVTGSAEYLQVSKVEKKTTISVRFLDMVNDQVSVDATFSADLAVY
jgi:hypothetical protein